MGFVGFLVMFAISLAEAIAYALGAGQGWAFMGIITMMGGLGFVYMGEQSKNRGEEE